MSKYEDLVEAFVRDAGFMHEAAREGMRSRLYQMIQQVESRILQPVGSEDLIREAQHQLRISADADISAEERDDDFAVVLRTLVGSVERRVLRPGEGDEALADAVAHAATRCNTGDLPLIPGMLKAFAQVRAQAVAQFAKSAGKTTLEIAEAAALWAMTPQSLTAQECARRAVDGLRVGEQRLRTCNTCGSDDPAKRKTVGASAVGGGLQSICKNDDFHEGARDE